MRSFMHLATEQILRKSEFLQANLSPRCRTDSRHNLNVPLNATVGHTRSVDPIFMSSIWQSETCTEQTARIVTSFKRLTGRDLLPLGLETASLEQRLFEAPFVLVSHGTEPDPVLNYGNATALKLWEMDWQEFTKTPSRYTAEAPNREERARLLAEVTKHGFIEDYSGVRISKKGKRFRIKRAFVWNLTDLQGTATGQAAMFSDWEML